MREQNYAKLQQAEQLIYEVAEDWSRVPKWHGSPHDVGILNSARLLLTHGVGLGLSEADEAARDLSRTEERLLWTMQKGSSR